MYCTTQNITKPYLLMHLQVCLEILGAKNLSILEFVIDYKLKTWILILTKKSYENSMMRLKQIHKHDFKSNQFG
jgi:hypothetical protein